MRDSDVNMCDGSLAFPLRVGDRKAYEKRPWSSGVGANSAECEVKGIESVSVPAGTFDAFRVQCDGAWTRVFDLRANASSKSGRFEDTIWYAPVVGREVKWTYVDYFGPGRVYNKKQTELTEFLPK
ncbi:hypothetical protein [Accumulibacter sp.]|uniref:hypothetical protein n=1 Tax=Accumulibacter sp. TaxID=2053492 RepID=UPI0025F05B0C|nr:hypothetical protein [Accumulibacter sp.]MCM8594513.1 hypothetical protein [Accumulibacter sp.]MCM8626778.1 hypothetical protein [Accumulibacter sp.]MDS4048659.1 hypothetical protein [Accumulibacter sp.]